MENQNIVIDERESPTKKIVAAVVLLLLALGAGTYAFVDMSQHKLDRASGDGAGYQITLHSIFDPTTADTWSTKTQVESTYTIPFVSALPLEEGCYYLPQFEPDWPTVIGMVVSSNAADCLANHPNHGWVKPNGLGKIQIHGPGPKGALPKVVYAATHEDSGAANVRISIWEFMGFGSDFPYTTKRFVTNPDDGNFLAVDGSLVVGAAESAFRARFPDAGYLDSLVGHEFSDADLWWFQTKLNQYSEDGSVDTSEANGGWFIRSARSDSDSNNIAARDGQLGAYLQYRAYASATAGDTDLTPVPSVKANIKEASPADGFTATLADNPLTPLVRGSSEVFVDNADVTVSKDPSTPSEHATIDGPGMDGTTPAGPDSISQSNADDYVKDAGYQVYNQSDLSAKFRSYIALAMPNVVPLSEYAGQSYVWIWDDVTGGGADGWFYWSNPTVPGTKTADLLESMTLLKQPPTSFVYSQYVSMQVISTDEDITSNWGPLTGRPTGTDKPTLKEILEDKRDDEPVTPLGGPIIGDVVHDCPPSVVCEAEEPEISEPVEPAEPLSPDVPPDFPPVFGDDSAIVEGSAVVDGFSLDIEPYAREVPAEEGEDLPARGDGTKDKPTCIPREDEECPGKKKEEDDLTGGEHPPTAQHTWSIYGSGFGSTVGLITVTGTLCGREEGRTCYNTINSWSDEKIVLTQNIAYGDAVSFAPITFVVTNPLTGVSNTYVWNGNKVDAGDIDAPTELLANPYWRVWSLANGYTSDLVSTQPSLNFSGENILGNVTLAYTCGTPPCAWSDTGANIVVYDSERTTARFPLADGLSPQIGDTATLSSALFTSPTFTFDGTIWTPDVPVGYQNKFKPSSSSITQQSSPSEKTIIYLSPAQQGLTATGAICYQQPGDATPSCFGSDNPDVVWNQVAESVTLTFPDLRLFITGTEFWVVERDQKASEHLNWNGTIFETILVGP